MKQVLDASQMKEAERFTIEQLGIPSIVLMERAALAVTRQIMTLYPQTEGFNVILFCGTGNNGADGLAVARQLMQEDYHVVVCVVGNPEKATKEFLLQYEILKNMKTEFLPIRTEKDLTKIPTPEHFICVDALFGIGCNRILEGIYASVIRFVNQSAPLTVIAVDIPSGLHSSTGEVLGIACRAGYTVTFEYLKTGLLLREGPEYAGEVVVKKVGISGPDSSSCCMLEEEDIPRIMPGRKIRGNKGTFGKVLCITGSKDMGGAMLLSAEAALRCGCGMVKVATPDKWQNELLHILPEAMFCDRNNMNNSEWENAFAWCDVVLIGCGLSLGTKEEEIVRLVLSSCGKTVIVDADALTILAGSLSLLQRRKEKGYITILTPHPGEFARLFSSPTQAQQYQDLSYLQNLAKEYGVILVAKDANSVIADGKQCWINTSGNDGLATAGSGDVLAGMLAGSFARCHQEIQNHLLSPGELTACTVFRHGHAGDLAAAKFGKDGMIAGNIISSII